MASVASITMTNGAGESYAFAEWGPMPLIGQRVENHRAGDQGVANRVISFTLSGYFKGNTHHEIVTKYQRLMDFLKCNDVLLTYNDGSGVVLSNQLMYVDGYSEPSDWRQFSGDYEIQFHYFDTFSPQTNQLGITCSYSSNAGSFTFDLPPQCGQSQKPLRQGKSQLYTPSGVRLANERTITLSGRLVGPNHASVAAKANALLGAFQDTGTLTYGSFINSITQVVSVDIPPIFSRNYVDYTIQLIAWTTNLYEFSSTMNASRIHLNPIVKENFYCDTRSVQTFSPSSQTINYNFKATSDTSDLAMAYLIPEVLNGVIAGGVEMQGGSQNLDRMKNSAEVSINMWYANAVIANVPTF